MRIIRSAPPPSRPAPPVAPVPPVIVVELPSAEAVWKDFDLQRERQLNANEDEVRAEDLDYVIPSGGRGLSSSPEWKFLFIPLVWHERKYMIFWGDAERGDVAQTYSVFKFGDDEEMDELVRKGIADQEDSVVVVDTDLEFQRHIDMIKRLLGLEEEDNVSDWEKPVPPSELRKHRQVKEWVRRFRPQWGFLIEKTLHLGDPTITGPFLEQFTGVDGRSFFQLVPPYDYHYETGGAKNSSRVWFLNPAKAWKPLLESIQSKDFPPPDIQPLFESDQKVLRLEPRTWEANAWRMRVMKQGEREQSLASRMFCLDLEWHGQRQTYIRGWPSCIPALRRAPAAAE
jgi:hypothetical protein